MDVKAYLSEPLFVPNYDNKNWFPPKSCWADVLVKPLLVTPKFCIKVSSLPSPSSLFSSLFPPPSSLERSSYKEREIYHLPVHFQMAAMAKVGLIWSQEQNSRYPMWVPRSKDLSPSPYCLPRSLAGTWITSGAARSWTHRVCWCCRRRLSLLHHGARPLFLCFW